MKTLSVVNSVAMSEHEIYIQSRFQDGIEVYDYNGVWLRTIEVDSYFGWTLKLYNNKLFYGSTDNSIKVYDLSLNKVINKINPIWKINNKNQNYDGRYTMPTGFCIFDDEVYVVDTFDNSIICLSIDGKFKYRRMLKDTLDVNLRVVRIDISEKYIVVTCVEVDAILLMDRNFKLIKSIIKTGNKNGEFEIPWDIKLTNKYIYISDLYNHRVQVLDYNLKFIKSYGSWGTKLGEFNYVYGMDINEKYAIFADTWNHGFQIWKKERENYIPYIEVKKPNMMQVLRPNRINIIDDNIVISDYLNHNFKFFDKKLKNYNKVLGTLGFEVGEFRYPSGIIKYENYYLCIDTRSGQVTKFKDGIASIFIKGHDGAPMSPNSNGFLHSLKDQKSLLKLPSDITCDSVGNIYIADIGHQVIAKFDKYAKFISYIGAGIIFVDNKTSFIGCCIDENKLYVTNPSKNEILIFNLDGKLIIKLDSLDLNVPTGIDIDTLYIAIADRLNHKIVILDKINFQVIKVIGKLGNQIGEFCAPWDVALSDKYLYIADSLNNRIQKIDIGDLYE